MPTGAGVWRRQRRATFRAEPSRACVARFERAGGSRDLFIGQPSAVPPDELLDAVAALRNRHPAELEKSPAQQRQLARVECYTLLRKIAPREVRWLSYAPFDETDPANRETWTQLAQAMAALETARGRAPERRSRSAPARLLAGHRPLLQMADALEG